MGAKKSTRQGTAQARAQGQMKTCGPGCWSSEVQGLWAGEFWKAVWENMGCSWSLRDGGVERRHLRGVDTTPWNVTALGESL